jgi:hypothetical protein
MSEKTSRPQQRSLRFWIAEPVVCERIDIHIELERAAADERHREGWIGHIRWRLGESSEDLLERLCESLLDLCLPKRVWTDNGSGVKSRRKGAGGDARR